MNFGLICLAALLIFGFIGLFIAILHGLTELINWRRDPRNPYRRFCRHCGQQQDVYCYDWSDGPSRGWWENMGKVNTDCDVGHEINDRIPL